MSSFPRGLAYAAIIVAIIAVGVLGLIVGYSLKPSASSSSPSAPTAKYADITLTVQGSWVLGPDGNLHDAFSPCNFTVYANQIVNLTVMSYDSGEHSFTSPTLGVNFQIPPTNTTGVPNISHFQFTVPSNAGEYRWHCTDPCDTDAGGWAMTTGSDGQPDQIGYMGGYVTVLP